MATKLESRFPSLTNWIASDGWVEIGGSPHEGGLAKAFDEGGCVFEGRPAYPSLDALLKDLDQGIANWCKENGIDLDE